MSDQQDRRHNCKNYQKPEFVVKPKFMVHLMLFLYVPYKKTKTGWKWFDETEEELKELLGEEKYQALKRALKKVKTLW